MEKPKGNLPPGSPEWLESMDVHNKKTVLIFLAEALLKIENQESQLLELQMLNNQYVERIHTLSETK